MMRRTQMAFIWSVVVLGALWSVWALWQTRQLESIRGQAEALLLPDAVLPEIAQIVSVVPDDAPLVGCFEGLQKWRLRYVMFAAEAYRQLGKQIAYQELLAVSQKAAEQHLACQPADAKAWLDLALILMEREGFSKATLDALVTSARLSPAEAWLAEWRLPYWVQIAPLAAENVEVQAAFRSDVAAIDKAYSWRKRRLYQKLGVSDSSELIQF